MKNLKIFLFICLICSLINCGLFWSPNSVVIENPEQTVKDARLIIDNFRKDVISQFGENRVQHGYFDFDERGSYPHLPVPKNKLPQSLKMEGLQYAIVCYDHIDLVFLKNPVYSEGLRIWSIDATQNHNDTPTKYKDIFSHIYDPDSPTSPKNIH